MEIRQIAFADLAAFDPGKWIGPHSEAWFFRGEDRWDWPEWLRGHNGTASHLPYGLDGPTYLTCRNKVGTVLAPPGVWVVLTDNDAVWTVPPEGAVRLGYVAPLATLDSTQ